MRRASILAVAAGGVLGLLSVAAPAGAQSVEITPLVGYAFGGSVRDAVLDEKYSFEASPAYGGTASVRVGGSWRFEVVYSRQETSLQREGGAPSFDIRVERYLAGFQEEKGEGSLRWFGGIWLGATRFVPGLEGFGSETRFGGALGLGVKTFLTRNLGLRFEARALYTLVSGSGGLVCTDGSCLFTFTGSGLWQGDVSAGLILAF